ncbi:MAG: sulfite exporter TauE/SafE family protein [Gemmatimonadota bacterium]|nr:sulfite exporter TauE/SafE family protein [Gemmatimonadota bacterium]
MEAGAAAYLVVGTVALVASGLTLVSGFGLGTLLLPAFALFTPVEVAIALTAIVHFLNNLFKLGLLARHADRAVVLRFGVPALLAASLGAQSLLWLADQPALFAYQLAGRVWLVEPVKLIVALLLVAFTLAELTPAFRRLALPPRYLPIGGVLSGFVGGLSGMQGALRSVFLVKSGLTKHAFVATGVVIACLVDVSRLISYTGMVREAHDSLDVGLLATAVLAAFAGAYGGSRVLDKITMHTVQWVVSGLLVLVAVGLGAGWI